MQRVISLQDHGERGGQFAAIIGGSLLLCDLSSEIRTEHSTPRRGIFELAGGKFYKYTGEVAPLSVELANLLYYNGSAGGDWIWSPVHYPTEIVGDDPKTRDGVMAAIQSMLDMVPFDVKVHWLQRRWIRYYSDGADVHQRSYIGVSMVQVPIWNPDWTPTDNPASVIIPKEVAYDTLRRCVECELSLRESLKKPKGTCETCDALFAGYTAKWPYAVKALRNLKSFPARPLLYEGPAWGMQFSIDGINVLDFCKVFVTDDAQFIASNWCQRDLRSTGGINLQLFQHTLDQWIVGPCIQHALAHGHSFKNLVVHRPKNEPPKYSYDLTCFARVLIQSAGDVDVALAQLKKEYQAAYLLVQKGNIGGLKQLLGVRMNYPSYSNDPQYAYRIVMPEQETKWGRVPLALSYSENRFWEIGTEYGLLHFDEAENRKILESLKSMLKFETKAVSGEAYTPPPAEVMGEINALTDANSKSHYRAIKVRKTDEAPKEKEA